MTLPESEPPAAPETDAEMESEQSGRSALMTCCAHNVRAFGVPAAKMHAISHISHKEKFRNVMTFQEYEYTTTPVFLTLGLTAGFVGGLPQAVWREQHATTPPTSASARANALSERGEAYECLAGLACL